MKLSSELKIESAHKTVSQVPQTSLKQQSIADEVLGRHGLFSNVNKDSREQKALFDQVIPEGFRLSEAKGKGDCFYDSCAQELNEWSGKNEYNIKSLRLLCHEYAVELDKRCSGNPQHPENWIAKAFNYDTIKYQEYLANVRYTVEEREAGEGLGGDKFAIWGEPHIDGRILCTRFGVKLHVIEQRDNPEDETKETQKFIISHNLINEIGLKNVGEDTIDWKDEKVLHIAVCNLHFVPILRKISIQSSVPHQVVSKEHKRNSSKGKEELDDIDSQSLKRSQVNDESFKPVHSNYELEDESSSSNVPCEQDVGGAYSEQHLIADIRALLREQKYETTPKCGSWFSLDKEYHPNTCEPEGDCFTLPEIHLAPPVDAYALDVPIDYFFNEKSRLCKPMLLKYHAALKDHFDGLRKISGDPEQLLKIIVGIVEDNNIPQKKWLIPFVRKLIEEDFNNDCFDSYIGEPSTYFSKITEQFKDKEVRILFPYRLKTASWNVGAVIISKNDSVCTLSFYCEGCDYVSKIQNDLKTVLKAIGIKKIEIKNKLPEDIRELINKIRDRIKNPQQKISNLNIEGNFLQDTKDFMHRLLNVIALSNSIRPPELNYLTIGPYFAEIIAPNSERLKKEHIRNLLHENHKKLKNFFDPYNLKLGGSAESSIMMYIHHNESESYIHFRVPPSQTELSKDPLASDSGIFIRVLKGRDDASISKFYTACCLAGSHFIVGKSDENPNISYSLLDPANPVPAGVRITKVEIADDGPSLYELAIWESYKTLARAIAETKNAKQRVTHLLADVEYYLNGINYLIGGTFTEEAFKQHIIAVNKRVEMHRKKIKKIFEKHGIVVDFESPFKNMDLSRKTPDEVIRAILRMFSGKGVKTIADLKNMSMMDWREVLRENYNDDAISLLNKMKEEIIDHFKSKGNEDEKLQKMLENTTKVVFESNGLDKEQKKKIMKEFIEAAKNCIISKDKKSESELIKLIDNLITKLNPWSDTWAESGVNTLGVAVDISRSSELRRLLMIMRGISDSKTERVCVMFEAQQLTTLEKLKQHFPTYYEKICALIFVLPIGRCDNLLGKDNRNLYHEKPHYGITAELIRDMNKLPYIEGDLGVKLITEVDRLVESYNLQDDSGLLKYIDYMLSINQGGQNRRALIRRLFIRLIQTSITNMRTKVIGIPDNVSDGMIFEVLLNLARHLANDANDYSGKSENEIYFLYNEDGFARKENVGDIAYIQKVNLINIWYFSGYGYILTPELRKEILKNLSILECLSIHNPSTLRLKFRSSIMFTYMATFGKSRHELLEGGKVLEAEHLYYETDCNFYDYLSSVIIFKQVCTEVRFEDLFIRKLKIKYSHKRIATNPFDKLHRCVEEMLDDRKCVTNVLIHNILEIYTVFFPSRIYDLLNHPAYGYKKNYKPRAPHPEFNVDPDRGYFFDDSLGFNKDNIEVNKEIARPNFRESIEKKLGIVNPVIDFRRALQSKLKRDVVTADQIKSFRDPLDDFIRERLRLSHDRYSYGEPEKIPPVLIKLLRVINKITHKSWKGYVSEKNSYLYGRRSLSDLIVVFQGSWIEYLLFLVKDDDHLLFIKKTGCFIEQVDIKKINDSTFTTDKIVRTIPLLLSHVKRGDSPKLEPPRLSGDIELPSNGNTTIDQAQLSSISTKIKTNKVASKNSILNENLRCKTNIKNSNHEEYILKPGEVLVTIGVDHNSHAYLYCIIFDEFGNEKHVIYEIGIVERPGIPPGYCRLHDDRNKETLVEAISGRKIVEEIPGGCNGFPFFKQPHERYIEIGGFVSQLRWAHIININAFRKAVAAINEMFVLNGDKVLVPFYRLGDDVMTGQKGQKVYKGSFFGEKIDAINCYGFCEKFVRWTGDEEAIKDLPKLKWDKFFKDPGLIPKNIQGVDSPKM